MFKRRGSQSLRGEGVTDISKCIGWRPAGFGEELQCPLRDTCWRYAAPASNYQAYIHAPFEGKKCVAHMPVKGGKVVVEVGA